MKLDLTSKAAPVEPSLRDSLVSTYGHILDSKALCKILCFPSVAALNAARARGRLPFRVVELEGRRGVFARTLDIANYLDASFGEAPRASAGVGQTAPASPMGARSA